MIKKLAKLAEKEDVILDYHIGPNVLTITVFGEHRDYIIINSLSFSDDEIIEITKDVIRRAKHD